MGMRGEPELEDALPAGSKRQAMSARLKRGGEWLEQSTPFQIVGALRPETVGPRSLDQERDI
jgi:hypothetical protein